MLKTLLTRTLSGAVFVALVLGSLMVSPYAFAVLFAFFAAVGLYEFYHESANAEKFSFMMLPDIVAGVLLFVAAFMKASAFSSFPYFAIYVLFVLCILFAELFRKKENPVHDMAFFIMGQVYVALPLSLLNFIVFHPSWQPAWLIILFVTIWMNDSWAYLFGVTLGKHRMFPRVSPKKSWEGFVGGAAMSLLTGWLCYKYAALIFPEFAQVSLDLWQWLLFAEIVVIAGTFGDLLESLIKRSFNIKDFGRIMPGHGGILDRFDSLLAASVAVWAFLQLLA